MSTLSRTNARICRKNPIYLFFESFAKMLHEEHRERDAEEIEDNALDCIWGFCSKSKMWFDKGLTDEEVQAQRAANEGSLTPG